METKLTGELFWLVATVTMTALFWVPYILNRMAEQGIGEAIWDPHGHTATSVAWAERLMRAHDNAVENLAIFAPLVLALHVLDISTPATRSACVVYFFARASHFLFLGFKVPVMRIVAFLTGFGAQMVLALTLFGLL